MANKDYLEQINRGVGVWNAWREKDPSIRPDLSAADLSAANLGRANLRGVNLGRAKLISADLSGADLSGADLSSADLRGADLSSANLNEANVNEADLRGADLSRANLSRAMLSRANLISANLNRANLRGTDLNGAKLSRANLSAAYFSEAYLRGANLSRADLSRADLSRADLSRAKLRGANLNQANLNQANLNEANLNEANLNEADLREADLSSAGLREAHLNGANLNEAKLIRANLSRANLSRANLIDACLDCANLTDAQFWETQRDGWSIKEVICQRALWDREGKEPIDYEEGEFERIFAEKLRIVLRYPGGMSPIDLIALPIVLERLQAGHPDSVLQIRSVQTDGGGASVTITVEDRAGRGPEAFGQELVRIQTSLEYVLEERDHLRRLLESTISQGISKIKEFLALPRQEIHVHRPIGLTAIEGPTTMNKGDTYNVSGQAGAVGRDAHAHDNTFQQIQRGIDLPKLAEELGLLRAAMKGDATGTREQDKAIGAVADAEEAAAKGDRSAVLRYLKGTGTWALGIAEKIGVPVAIEALKSAM